MFKKMLSAITLVTLTMGANAYEIGQNNTSNVEVYGVVAMSAVNYNVTNVDNSSTGTKGTLLENETRIGFRADKEMVQGLKVFMQVESGYVDNTDGAHTYPSEKNPVAGGVLGFRDTFVGLKGDRWGQVRFGRVLTPLYEIVDWPFSNPGLGSVFDWGGISANYDRQSNQIRFDSLNYGGFVFATSVGRNSAYQSSKDHQTDDSHFYGGSAKYTFSTVTLMSAVEAGNNFKGVQGQDNLTYLGGFSAELGGGFSLAAAYKQKKLDGVEFDPKSKPNTYIDETQGSYSVVGNYQISDTMLLRLGYAANLKAKLTGTNDDPNAKSETASIHTVSTQFMLLLNGFVPYVRVAGRSVAQKNTDIVTRVGIEYGF